MVRGDYTKQRFVDTFLRMCDTQKLSDITVTSLIAEAHTARQTFYNHFEDINGLVSYIPINFMEEFWRPASKPYARPITTPTSTKASSASCPSMPGRTISATPSSSITARFCTVRS